MTDHNLTNSALSDEQAAAAWAPTPNLRWWLLIGVWAVAADLCLSTASLCIELARTKETTGFTITDGLDWAVLLPHVFVLLTFLSLAREAKSIGLWRSSIGVFASMWLLALWSAMPTSEAKDFGPWDSLSAVLLMIAIIGVFVIISRRPPLFRQPAAEQPPQPEIESNEAGANTSEKPKWGCFSMLVAFAAAHALRKLFRRLGIGMGHVETIVTIAVPLCVLGALVVFLVCFGICKIRLRRKLGPVAALSGWADLASAVLTVVLYAFMAVAMVQAALQDQEIDSYSPKMHFATAATDGFDLVWKAMFAAMFLSIRGRVEPTAVLEHE